MGITLEGFVGRSAISDEERALIPELLPKGGKLLELGTLDGVSVAYWATERPDCEFLTVDPFRVGHGTGSGTLKNWVANHRQNQRLFVGVSADLHGFERQFDIAFVDGDHEYNACLKDLAAVERMVCIRGLILAHDYAHRASMFKGVTSAVDDFCAGSSMKIERVVDTTAIIRRTE